jgi:hypothetical protein
MARVSFGGKVDPLAKELDDLRQKARGARRLLEPGWFMDLAFFQGNQWLVWSGDRLRKPDMGPAQITVTENRIAGVIRTELAKMTKNRPVFTVTPNTGSEDDAVASELAERVMRFMWKHLKMHEQSLKALEWSRIVCAGFLKCYWDSSVGDPIDVVLGPDGQILEGLQGKVVRAGSPEHLAAMAVNPAVKTKRVAQGDIRVEVRSPFQMFIDPLCDSFPDAEWVIEESIKSEDYIYQRYKTDLKPDAPANPGLIESRLMGMMTGQSTSGYMGVRLREAWYKPCRKYPNGAKIVWAQGKVLEMDEKPFDPQPYVMLTGIPVPGRLWPMGVVSLLRSPQTELNKVASQMAENRNRVGNPTILVSKQGPIDVDKVIESFSAPGGLYFYDDIGTPNAKPSYLEAPPLPEYVPEERERLQKTIEDISGQHEVTNANVPPGVTAASAITLLQEADDTRLGLAIQDYEEQLGRFGQKILNLVANFYTDSRTLTLAGEDAAFDIFDFKGAMLRGNTHVEVQAGSAFPQSKAAKQAQLTDWLRMMAQMGVQMTPRQISQYLRDSGMGATERLVEDYNSTEIQANRENVLLAQGQPVDINPQDDDEGHIANHEDFERQPRFFNFPPNIQALHQAHTQKHRDRLQAQQQQQMENELMLAGQVPPTLTQAAFQETQQLSNIQGLQQILGQSQQAQQQAQGQAQQQGFDQAAQQQQQRHAEELHQAKLSQLQAESQRQAELHQQKLHQAEEQHQQRLRSQAQQAQQRPQPAKS